MPGCFGTCLDSSNVATRLARTMSKPFFCGNMKFFEKICASALCCVVHASVLSARFSVSAAECAVWVRGTSFLSTRNGFTPTSAPRGTYFSQTLVSWMGLEVLAARSTPPLIRSSSHLRRHAGCGTANWESPLGHDRRYRCAVRFITALLRRRGTSFCQAQQHSHNTILVW